MKSVILRFRWALILVIAAFAISGCPKNLPGVLESKRLKPLDSAVESEFLSGLERCSKLIHSARGRAKIAVKKFPALKQQLNQVLAFQRPDKLRLEFFATNLNRLLSIITIENGTIRAVNATEKQYLVGRSSPENLAKLLTVPFSAEEAMVWFLAAYYPPDEFNGGDNHLYQPNPRELLVEFVLNDGRLIGLVYDKQKDDSGCARPKSLFVKDRQGEVIFASVYRYRQGIEEMAGKEKSEVLAGISAEIPEISLQLDIDYQSLEVNPQWDELSSRIFRLKIPITAIPVSLDSLEQNQPELNVYR